MRSVFAVLEIAVINEALVKHLLPTVLFAGTTRLKSRPSPSELSLERPGLLRNGENTRQDSREYLRR